LPTFVSKKFLSFFGEIFSALFCVNTLDSFFYFHANAFGINLLIDGAIGPVVLVEDVNRFEIIERADVLGFLKLISPLMVDAFRNAMIIYFLKL